MKKGSYFTRVSLAELAAALYPLLQPYIKRQCTFDAMLRQQTAAPWLPRSTKVGPFQMRLRVGSLCTMSPLADEAQQDVRRLANGA